MAEPIERTEAFIEAQKQAINEVVMAAVKSGEIVNAEQLEIIVKHMEEKAAKQTQQESQQR